MNEFVKFAGKNLKLNVILENIAIPAKNFQISQKLQDYFITVKPKGEVKMKIIQPSVELMRDFDGVEVMKFIERCGRTCYKSEKNITADSAEKFVRNLIKRGHESVLEHFSATFKIICDRGVMAELTRHRLASFSIESTRYNNYNSSKNSFEISVVCPFQPIPDNTFLPFLDWKRSMENAENSYMRLTSKGIKPEIARAVLPNSLKTEIVMTANLRELRHILKLRTAKDAHPQMRQIANMILKILKQKLPVVFEDIGA